MQIVNTKLLPIIKLKPKINFGNLVQFQILLKFTYFSSINPQAFCYISVIRPEMYEPTCTNCIQNLNCYYHVNI